MLLTGPQKKYLVHVERPHGKVKAEHRQREIGPGAHAFIRVRGWRALRFLGKAGWINSNK